VVDVNNQAPIEKCLRFIACLWKLEDSDSISQQEVGRIILAGAVNFRRTGQQDANALSVALQNMIDEADSILHRSPALLTQLHRDFGLEAESKYGLPFAK
jgi:hypothetical protein